MKFKKSTYALFWFLCLLPFLAAAISTHFFHNLLSTSKTVKGLKSFIEDLFSGAGPDVADYPGNKTLLWVVLFLAFVVFVRLLRTKLKPPFFKRHVLPNKMKRLWMYDSSTYLNALAFLGLALVFLIGSVLSISLTAYLLWILLWILYILTWIIAIASIIATIGGSIAFFGGENYGCLATIVGAPIMYLTFDGKITGWGEDLLDRYGVKFHDNGDAIMKWLYGFVSSFWDDMLFVLLAPVAAFLLVAVALIVLCFILNAADYVFTRIYSIHRPCPCCGNKGILEYVVDGKVHPVKLHPGVYGIFRHYSPDAGKHIPTMLLNGKGELTRHCPLCHTYINADSALSYGTDIHIGFVGPRSSGKSYLLYSGLNLLLCKYPKHVRQVDASVFTAIKDKAQRIARGEGIQTSVANQYRAIQLMVKPSKSRLVPYHLFFYDVAGEKFDAKSSSYKTAMSFYQNVQTIVFILDPSMIDFAGLCPSKGILNWAASVNKGETHNPENSFAVLLDILETVGRQAKEINFNFVCTKSDLGYFEAENIHKTALTEAKIKEFIKKSLGLTNLVNSAENLFKSVRYFEASINEGEKTRQLFETLIEQQADDEDIFA